jgi:uncharacterized protein (TIGR03643 family)
LGKRKIEDKGFQTKTCFACFSKMENNLYCYYSEANKELNVGDIDRIIEMAWEDRTPFDAIKIQFGLNEQAVRNLMRKELKISSYRLWRKRVENCKTKHIKTRSEEINRFKCNLQRTISNNKISKR